MNFDYEKKKLRIFRATKDLEESINYSRVLDADNSLLTNLLKSIELKRKEFQTVNSILELKCIGLEMKVEDHEKMKQSFAKKEHDQVKSDYSLVGNKVRDLTAEIKNVNTMNRCMQDDRNSLQKSVDLYKSKSYLM